MRRTPCSARIAAGAQCIEHAHLMDDATARLMADKGVWLSTQPFLSEDDTGALTGPSRVASLQVFAGTDNAYGLANKHKIKTAFGSDMLFSPALAARQGIMLTHLARWYSNADILRWRRPTTPSCSPCPARATPILASWASSRRAPTPICWWSTAIRSTTSAARRSRQQPRRHHEGRQDPQEPHQGVTMPPIVMALIPTVLLLVWMGFFMMGSLPLLVLKHDTPLDSRFIRGLFNVYYLAVMLTAGAAALGYAWTAKPAFALGMACIATLAFVWPAGSSSRAWTCCATRSRPPTPRSPVSAGFTSSA